MARTITLRDVKTGEVLYPDSLIKNTFDSDGNNLTTVLAKKADLVNGVIPISQLPSVVVSGGIKGVIVNDVEGTVNEETGAAVVRISARNLKTSKVFVSVANAPEDYEAVQADEILDDAISKLDSNIVKVFTKTKNLVNVIGINDETYTPGSTSYIRNASTLKEAVDILDDSLNLEVQNCKNYTESLLEWAEKD